LRRVVLLLVALDLVASVAIGCGSSATATPSNAGDVLFQYSSLQTLMAGVYDGELTAGELRQHGDFGLGTFNKLDGEMVVLDGTVYQVKTDGVAYRVADSQKIPFAEVTEFGADQTIEVDRTLDCTGLQSYLDAKLPSLNVPYAIKIDGSFAQLQTRSVPAQTRPYPPLADVVKKQTTFDFTDVSGTMVGFRLPSYMAGVGAAGYHLHFLTTDRKAGGHVLSCQVQKVTAEIDLTGDMNLVLPSDPDFYHVDLSTPTPASTGKSE
jgi:acetolactate decarboxylase